MTRGMRMAAVEMMGVSKCVWGEAREGRWLDCLWLGGYVDFDVFVVVVLWMIEMMMRS